MTKLLTIFCSLSLSLSLCVSLSVSQGRIACANVLSDLYAMGITECDNMLMLLSVSQKMNDKVVLCVLKAGCQTVFSFIYLCHCSLSSINLTGIYVDISKISCHDSIQSVCTCTTQDRERVMPLMIQGFRDAAEEGGTSVTGGQTVINPWIIVGGVASVVCQPNEFIM